MRPYPDDRTVHPISYSLYGAVTRSAQLLSEDEDVFTRFILAGREKLGPGLLETRAWTLSIEEDLEPVDATMLIKRRDYDSMFGATGSLCYVVPMTVFPYPPFRETLRTETHIKAYALRGDEEVWMPMHKIPNFAFGTVARRHVVRIFLPRLWRQGEDPIVTPLHLARIYNRVVLPLVKEMFPNEATHWPPSYRGAELLAQTCGQGGFARMGYDVQPDRLAEFGERVLARLGEVDRAYRDAYFGHELRGYKGATAHDPDEEEEREGSLETMLSVLDRDQVDEDRWYIDVAMEFGRRGHVVTWASRSHAEILLAICPGLRREHVERRMKSKQYHLDRLSHLLEVAGFRAEMEFWGRKEVLWAQCYTTDKAASAQLHNGIFKTRWPSELLKESELDRLLRDMVKMSEMLAICAGKGEVEEGVEATAQDACARVEVRVTLAQALTDLVDLPDGLLERGLLQIPSWQWWLLKYLRVYAANVVLGSMVNSILPERQVHHALVIGAMAIWIMNGTFRNPLEKLEDLAMLACPIVETDPDLDDEVADDLLDDEMEPLMFEAGIYFVCDTVRDKDSQQYRIPINRSLQEDAVCKAFGAANYEHLRSKLGAAVFARVEPSNPDRNNNRAAGRERDVNEWRDEDRERPQFAEELQGIRLHGPLVLEGDDVDLARVTRNGIAQVVYDELPADREAGPVAEGIWEQFMFDAIMEASNQRAFTKGSHLTLDRRQRIEESTERLFKALGMPFRQVQYKRCPTKTWRMHFDRCFPLVFPTKAAQNWKECKYFKDWFRLLRRLNDDERKEVREALWRQWDQLLWAPFTGSDRMWGTKCWENIRGAANWVRLPAMPNDVAATHIALSPRVPRNEEPYILPAGMLTLEEATGDEIDANL